MRAYDPAAPGKPMNLKSAPGPQQPGRLVSRHRASWRRPVANIVKSPYAGTWQCFYHRAGTSGMIDSRGK